MQWQWLYTYTIHYTTHLKIILEKWEDCITAVASTIVMYDSHTAKQINAAKSQRNKLCLIQPQVQTTICIYSHYACPNQNNKLFCKSAINHLHLNANYICDFRVSNYVIWISILICYFTNQYCDRKTDEYGGHNCGVFLM